MPLPDNFKPNVASEGSVFEAINSGVYEVGVVDIEDMGMVDDIYNKGEKKHMLVFTFEISEGDYKGHTLRKWVNNAWSPGGQFKPSNLYVITSCCMEVDKNMPPEDLNILIGKNLKITVKKQKKEDGTEKNIITDFMESDMRAAADEIDAE